MKEFIYIIIIFAVMSSPLFGNNPKEQFLKAKGEVNQQDFQILLEEIFMESPGSYYGQLSLLELGKIEILKRDYGKAISYLQQIHHPDVLEKEFWLAEAYFKNEQFDTAIVASQNYIFGSEKKEKIELAYFLIAESYIQKKNYSKALNTLDYLRNSEFISNNIPLLHFKIGYCHEMKGDYDSAALSYRKLKLDFPYHQLTYQAEERLNNLGNPTVDIAKLEDPKNDIVAKPPTKIVQDTNKEQRYLQVGVFGSKENAEKMTTNIDNILPGKSTRFPRKDNGKILHVVAAGPFYNDDTLNEAKTKLSDANISSFEIKK